jgi:hypothetical protein
LVVVLFHEVKKKYCGAMFHRLKGAFPPLRERGITPVAQNVVQRVDEINVTAGNRRHGVSRRGEIREM